MMVHSSAGDGRSVRAAACAHVPTLLVAVAIACLLVVLAGCSAAEPATNEQGAEGETIGVQEAEEQTGIAAEGEGVDYLEGEVLVTLAADASQDDVAALLRGTASVREQELADDMMVDGFLEDGMVRAGALGEPVVLVHTAEGAAVVQAIAELQHSDLVVDAQPNFIFVLDGDGSEFVPDDDVA